MPVGLALLLLVLVVLAAAAAADLAARRKGRRIRIDAGELRAARREVRLQARRHRLQSPDGPSRARRRQDGPPRL